MTISKNENYFYINNGQIEQFKGVYKEGETHERARLKDLRDLIIKCANVSLAPQINEKIDNYNAKLTKRSFGWFFRLFKLERLPPLEIKVTMKRGDKATKLQNELKQMVKSRDFSRRVLSSGNCSQAQTAITYNPDSKKFLLIAGAYEGVQWNGEQISPQKSIELKRGKNLIIVPHQLPMKPHKEILIEIY